MIVLCLGNVGSGKTLCTVREMVNNTTNLKYFTNIIPKKKKLTPWINAIKPEMIVSKELKGLKKKKDGTTEEVFELKLNKDFWKSIKEPVSVVIDEAHTMMNPRRAMSKVNIIMGDFVALARRALGEDSTGRGDLIFITQLDRRIDPIARDMAHLVKYHVAHFTKTCENCGVSWSENSDFPEPVRLCPRCGSYELRRSNFSIEIKHFAGIQPYEAWREFGMKTWHKHYFVTDVDNYFGFYDSLQWDNMFSELY